MSTDKMSTHKISTDIMSHRQNVDRQNACKTLKPGLAKYAVDANLIRCFDANLVHQS